MVQVRKQKRDDLLMKRRGLNFITEDHEGLLDEDTIQMVEQEVDNVAPKIIAIMPLSEYCDTAIIKE